MLYLDRRVGESLIIGDDVTVKFLGWDPYGEAIIGIDAPPEISIDRKEVFNKKNNYQPVAPIITYKNRRTI